MYTCEVFFVCMYVYLYVCSTSPKEDAEQRISVTFKDTMELSSGVRLTSPFKYGNNVFKCLDTNGGCASQKKAMATMMSAMCVLLDLCFSWMYVCTSASPSSVFRSSSTREATIFSQWVRDCCLRTLTYLICRDVCIYVCM